ncbi:MAG: BatD family protein [Gemmatimonadota bacterium]|nr:BatD family protein [Gemmatimonadota bacterium]
MRHSPIYIFLLCLAALLLPSKPAAAQDVSVQLSVDRSEVSVNDRLKMTVRVSGAVRNVKEANVANLERFTVVGTSTSTEFSMVNARISYSTSTTYTLHPSREGTFTIGPAEVEVKGKTYRSNTVKVTVRAGAGGSAGTPGAGRPQAKPQPQPGSGKPGGASSALNENIFVRGTVDKQEVYQGEQLIYIFGFYNRVNLFQTPAYTPAAFNGFWVESLDENSRRSRQNVGGAVYDVHELSYALFPSISGEATISPARLTVSVSNTWNFFGRGRTSTLETKEFKIKVKPLPSEGRPAGFSGAVGDFRISSRLDKQSVTVGEPMTLEVVVSGTGNLKTIGEPRLPEMTDFDIYESKTDEQIERTSSGISGRKVFSYVIVPRKAGNIEWPGIQMAWFDPRAEKYRTAQTRGISFAVLQGEQEPRDQPFRFLSGKVLALNEDIRYIKEGLSALRPAPAAWQQYRLFWLMHLVPLVFLGLALAYRRHRGRMMSDMGYARLKGARKSLARLIREASRELAAGRLAQCYSALDRALINFIGDKLNVETTGMLVEQIAALLEKRNLDEAARDQVVECLEHFALVRFAPDSGDSQDAENYLKKVRRLVERLDRAL